jgi:LEA14-like dessication related protein
MQGVARILFWALPAAVVVSSCGGLRHTRVEEVRTVSVQAAGGGKMLVNMDVRVANRSCRTLRLTKLEINVALRDAAFATLTAADVLTVPPRSNAFQPIALELRLQNMLAILMGALQQEQMSPDEMTVEGELRVSAFPFGQTVKIEKQPLRAFAAQYGDWITPLLKLQGK